MRQVLTSKLHTSSNVTLYWKKHNKISSSSTHISLAWVPSLPLDALHRVYRSVLGVNSVHMATPLRCVAVQLWHCQTTVHIPLLVSAVVCLCCGCFCVLVELSRVTCRVHRMWASIISRLDNVPTPTPCLRPRQQCQLQPVPSISYINIIFFLWFLFDMGPPSGALHLKIYQSQQGLRCRLIKVNLFYVDDGVLKVYLQLPHSL